MKLRGATAVVAAMLLGLIVASDTLAARNGGRSGGHGGSPSGARPAAAGAHGAHGGHYPGGGRYVPRYRAGVYIGAPLFAPFSLYSHPTPLPYYDYPLPLMAPSAPVYIEQYPGSADPQHSLDWYYCASSNSYYPYVRDCAEGWQRVAPQPPY